VLLYQFHDILPGLSIKRVYDECLPRYAELLRDVTEQTATHEARLAERVDTSAMQRPVIVRNSLAWERVEWVKAGERWMRVSVPPLGYTTVDLASAADDIPGLVATARRLENDLLRVEFDDDGSIRSIYDKRADREIVPAGQRTNRLACTRTAATPGIFRSTTPTSFRATPPVSARQRLSMARARRSPRSTGSALRSLFSRSC
jgi:alpha-mannosidase